MTYCALAGGICFSHTVSFYWAPAEGMDALIFVCPCSNRCVIPTGLPYALRLFHQHEPSSLQDTARMSSCFLVKYDPLMTEDSDALAFLPLSSPHTGYPLVSWGTATCVHATCHQIFPFCSFRRGISDGGRADWGRLSAGARQCRHSRVAGIPTHAHSDLPGCCARNPRACGDQHAAEVSAPSVDHIEPDSRAPCGHSDWVDV